MSDACGCGNDELRSEEAEEHEPERLWEVTELRAAAEVVVLANGVPAGRAKPLTTTSPSGRPASPVPVGAQH